LASRLLRHLGSIRKVFQASEKELEQVDGVGRVKAERIAKLLDSRYEDTEERPEQARKLL